MKTLINRIRRCWVLLHKEIYVGDLRTQNMRACMFVGIAITIAATTLTTMNLMVNRDVITIATTVIQAISGIVIVIFIRRDQKLIPTLMMILICIVTFTYYVFSGATGGTTAMWTILVPLGVGYFGNALYGIYCGIYFQILLVVLYYTPLRVHFEDKYSRFFMDRFPVLYFLNLALMSICLINYHLSVLKLLDTAEELRKSKEEADRANRGKSDFLSNMSHEIRTPINAVLGMNEMILRESINASQNVPTDPESARLIFSDIAGYSGNIGSAGNNLLYLINDILDFSKIESGKMQLVETDYILSTLLNDVSNMIFFKARDKGLEFEMDVDENIPDILHGDEIRVRQIFTNILSNAVKYTRKGSVHLKVSGEEIKGSSSRVFDLKVVVSDTGIGIKEEDIGKLFAKFERVDLEQTGTVEGTGLGLAITRNLLDMMGGEISVKSTYGEGSAFTVILPQLIVSDEPVGDFRRKFNESIRAMEAYEESFRAPTAHILIVDDTRMNLLVVEGLLKETALKIDTASSGAEAVRLTRTNTYDLILMDQRMPGMGGTETMLQIRAEKGANADVPFICLTADAISGARERYMGVGFTDYITKPIDYKALEKMLIKYLPSEKVILSNGRLDKHRSGAASKYDELSLGGIDVGTGLYYCKSDTSFYESLLKDYADGYEEKKALLEEYHASSDRDDYGTCVHSLKSASRLIGAIRLSDIAASAERASDEGDTAETERLHGEIMKLYEDTYRTIIVAFPEFAGGDDSDGTTPDPDAIIEFAPEDVSEGSERI